MNVRFKRQKVLTRPVLKLIEGTPVYVKIQGPMHIGKEMKAKEGEKKKDPATIMDAINLESGEECQVIASAVIKSVLDESYPKEGYVGKCFALTKQARQPGKQYNPVHIEEIEEPGDSPAASAATLETSSVESASDVGDAAKVLGGRRR